jgi:hypothetical protein
MLVPGGITVNVMDVRILLLAAVFCGASCSEPPSCVDAYSPEMQGELRVGTKEGGAAASLRVLQGDRRTLQFYARNGSVISAPHACATWRVEPPEAAKIEGDVLKVGYLSPAGSTFKVIGETPRPGRLKQWISGFKSYRISAEFSIVDPQILIGSWQATESSCALLGPIPLEQFELKPDSTFLSTWHPFERAIDGRYELDTASGAIKVETDQGPLVLRTRAGADLLSAAEKGTLELEVSHDKGKPCRYQFKKRR